MEGLKIVEYTPAYAKAVAEMWQKSTEGWNGEMANETEETVLAEHAATANINTYLAVLGGEVLGYCGFSRYREDEGALYISTLNARYDYHGKGIGKTLVKKSIERTIELKWPRLDLYTWPANTKSIPLYKKCGFFLENRQDTTHLMNFMPTVMQTEAVKNFFQDADWYDDMKRIIDIEPDGRVENEFEFYEYNWEKNGKKLRMEFERKGRGLRLIENDDYMISLSALSQNLIIGKSYKAAFEIINKSGKPLYVEIAGGDDKNIRFALNKKVQIAEKEIVEGNFYLSEIEEEFGKLKTHPGITAHVVINGENVLFKLGIVPKFPAKISFCCEDLERYSGESLTVYVNIESCLEENGIFEFELPESNDIVFSKRVFEIELAKKQRISIPIQCILRNPCIYKAELNFKVELQSGEKVHFHKNVAAIFRGRHSAYGEEVSGKYVIVNGTYKLTLNKSNNKVEVFLGNKKSSTYFMYPKLGKPYSQEFSSMLAKNVTWYYDNEKMYLSGEYASKEFKNIIVKSIFNISKDGILEHFYEICNSLDDEIPDDIYINQSFHYSLAGAFIPYNNKILQVTEPGLEYNEYFDSSKISENWLFASAEAKTESLIWPQNIKLAFDSWFINLEHNIGKLKRKERRVTEPIYLAISTFKNYDEARKYALKSYEIADLYLVEDYEIDINNRNPFVNESINVSITENRRILRDGEIIVKSKNNCFDKINEKLLGNEKNINIPIHTKKGFGNDIIFIESNLSSLSLERKVPVFYIRNMEFKSQITRDNGSTIYSISNGIINIKASPNFSLGLFSINFMDKEWLDSSFPKAFPRTWYNPWFGGIQNLPEVQMESARSLLKEHIEVEFVEKDDSLGNMWMGIETSLCIAQNDDYKGLQIDQYYLMLPGVPVILHMTKVSNKMDEYIDSCDIVNSGFFKISEEIRGNWASVKNRNKEITKYRAGSVEYDLNCNSSILYGSDDIEYKIQVYMNPDGRENRAFLDAQNFGCLNRINISIAANETKFLPNIFYIFTKEHVSDKLLKSLKNIRFE